MENATTVATATDDERTLAVEGLYEKCFDSLISNTTSRDVMAWQARNAVTGLRRYLRDYDGPLTEYAFLMWSMGILAPASAVLVLYERYRGLIESGFWSVLRSCPDLIENHKSQSDPMADEAPDGYTPIRATGTLAELQSDLIVWMLEHLDSLLGPDNTAKISTRLRKKAYYVARTWKTNRLRYRKRYSEDGEDAEKRLIYRGSMLANGKLPYIVTGWAAEYDSENKVTESVFECP